MKISGEASLAAGVADVYAALNDPAVLVRTIPGCQRLQQVGTDSYKATIMAGVASIKAPSTVTCALPTRTHPIRSPCTRRAPACPAR